MLGNCPISPPGGWGSQKPPAGVGIDRSHPSAAGLRLFTLLNEGAGARINDAAEGRAGTLKNASTTNSWGARPDWLTLDGTDDRIDFPSLCDPSHIAQTIGCCVYVRALPSNNCYLWGAQQAGDAVVGTLLNIYSTGCFSFRLSNAAASSATARSSATGLIQAGNSYTLFASYDGSNTYGGIHLYINGGKVSAYSEENNDTPVNAPGLWTIGGRSYDNVRNVNGAIKWLGWWNRVLSPSEIANLCSQPFAIFGAAESFAAGDAARPLVDGSLAADSSLVGEIA